MKINVLEPSVYNKISAGEVVERPASIVKELIENSIDAGAKNIRIEIEGGGIKNITVSDDGCGIDKDDLVAAFLPHATSKIKSAQDLEAIASLGFRGEALASIAAVCQVRLSSKTAEGSVGYSIKVDGGEFGPITELARNQGTTISCSNLFFNTPVRAKFLRKPKSEEAEITHLVERLMMSFSEIAFQYYIDGKQIYNTKSCSMSDIIYTIYGKEIYDNLIEVNYQDKGFIVSGYVTKPQISKSNRTYQTLFINKRYVENSLISTCVSNVYSSFLMKGRFPVYVLSIDVPPENVDVNVHPSKREVRFENTNFIYALVSRAVEKALLGIDQIQSFFNFENVNLSENHIDTQKEVEAPTPKIEMDEDEVFSAKTDKKIDTAINFKNNFGGKSFEELIDENDRALMPKEYEITPTPTKREDFSNLENLSLGEFRELKRKNTLVFDQTGEKFNALLEEESKGFIHASVKDEMNILGTIFKTYIVIEYNNSIYFIDQHAGHERILYDRLVKTINDGKAKQQLLVPYTFTVGPKEAQDLDLILDNLDEVGFEIEKNGYNYTIKTIPYLLSSIDLKKFADEIVAESFGLIHKASDYVHSRLCQSACKHAIKAGDTISKEDCAYLIEEVRKGVMLCPHGRPITLIITKHDFEKMFKRIV